MWRDLGLTKRDWDRTPQAVRSLLITLHQQVRLMGIRFQAYEKLIADFQHQLAQVDDLKAEIAELRERLGQNSRNSSRPPSTDPPSEKQQPTRQATGRRRGGQKGHQGHQRQMVPSTEGNHLIICKPASCQHCGLKLRGSDPQPVRHQLWEVPPVRAEVTEYQHHCLTCQGCGALTRAEWPEQMTAGAFGPRTQAIVGYLSGRLGASHRDVVEVMKVIYGLELSLGSVARMQQQVSRALAEHWARAERFVQHQQAQYVDETSWCEAGRQMWLWINATAEVTLFKLLDGRSAAAAQQVINQEANGTVSRARLQVRVKPIRQRVSELLQAGSKVAAAKTRRTCQNILKVEQSLWTFIRVVGVEPTNNDAERGLRRAVLWRRKSFGTQSDSGSRFVERILTAVTSLRQQGREVLDYLTATCRAALEKQVPKGLVPDSS